MSLTTADLVAYVGDALVFLMCAAQAPTYYRAVFVLKTVEGISILPTVGLFANFVTWILYAVVKKETNVLQVRRCTRGTPRSITEAVSRSHRAA